MKKRKKKLDLEIRKLTKAVMKGSYSECNPAQTDHCVPKCVNGVLDN